MVIESRQSVPVDPLEDYMGFALFPKIFGVLPDHSKPHNPDLDLQAIHSHLKSMASRSVNRLREQAKNILDGNSNLLSTGISVHQETIVKNEAIPAKFNENSLECLPDLDSLKPDSSQPTASLLLPLDHTKLKDPKEFFEAHDKHESARQDIQKRLGGDVLTLHTDTCRYTRPRERRPDLGRKRARFSLKPDSIQTAVSTESTIDIENLKDPREFFADHERQENGKQEIQNQFRGDVCDLGLVKPRERRPDLGRKRARFSLKPGSSEPVVSLGATLDMGKLKEPENLRDNEKHESSTDKAQKETSKILDALLSLDCEDLEGERALSVLQERLQIKPIELEKLCLPDFVDFPKIDLKSSRENLLKPRRPLSDIDNLLKEMHSKAPTRLNEGALSSASPLFSPTPLKSPFASLALLNKRISQTNLSVDSPTAPKSPFASLTLLNKRISQTSPSADPFSVDGIEQLPVQPVSLENMVGSVDVQKHPDHMNSPLIRKDEDPEGANTILSVVVVEDINHTSEKSTNDNLGKPGDFVDMDSQPSLIVSMNKVRDSNMRNMVISCKSGEPDIDGASQASGPNIIDNAEDASQVAVPPGHLDLNMASLDNLNDTEIQSDKTSTPSHDNHAMYENLRSPDQSVKQHKTRKNRNSRRSRKQSSEKSGLPKEHKRKEVSRRQSLAGAGTIMKSGVRKSTRIRTRPLEYWKGERLLYGRVHQSLATVIGMKYVSPTKVDGTSTLKVKSFVSDEYKDLVELAALH